MWDLISTYLVRDSIAALADIEVVVAATKFDSTTDTAEEVKSEDTEAPSL